MEWLNNVVYFFGGMFLSNSIPHLVSGNNPEKKVSNNLDFI